MIILEKYAEIADADMKLFKGDRDLNGIKSLLKLPRNRKIVVGTTYAHIGKTPKKNEVYKNQVDGTTSFYIVTKPIGNDGAFCESVYLI